MTNPRKNAAVIGDFISGMPGRNLPEAVVDAARFCLADWIAVGLGARDEAAGRVVRKTIAGWRTSGASTVLFGQPAAAPMAALANGTLAHCLDFDDTHTSSNTHTSAPVWAATLAAGEARRASESEMLAAFIAGFEVAVRVGRGLGQPLTARGLHATGVFGRIGAAAAAATIHKLDRERAVHALAAAATQASGLTASFGTMAKPFHAGKAAMDGVLSAELAAEGFHAAPIVLEAEGGLDRALFQDGSFRIAPADFSEWEILGNSFKPYAACHLVHPSLDAARGIGIAPDTIRSARVAVSPLAMQITGGTDGKPSSPLAAKFDLRYCVALALHGHTLSAGDFLEPWTASKEVLATAARIAPAADSAYGYASARLDITDTSGREKSLHIATGKGHPGNPMTWDDMWAKFDGLVTPLLGRDARPLFDHVRGFGNGQAIPGIQTALGKIAA